jgi:glucokinase
METSDRICIGVDLGGTNIEAAAVQHGKVLVSKKINTQAKKGPEIVLDRTEKVVRGVLAKMGLSPGDFGALCIGAPGAVDHNTGVVLDAPNLDMKDFPLAPRLQERLGLPVILDNDVNVGVLGEFVYGAGQGSNHMIGIFVGTGIGGGVIINGEMHYGGRGAAGEIGHTVIKPRGRRCGCGRRGCIEAYASKTAMAKMILEGIKKGQKSVISKHLNKKGKLLLTSSVISAALEQEDQLMIEVFNTAQYYLGLLTANLVNTLDPEVVVIGGGLVEELGKDFVKSIAKTAQKHYLQQQDADQVRILASTLGDHAGTIGAAVAAERWLRSR